MNIAISEDDVVGPLREALVVAAVAGMSGALRVTGDPGGTIHLADGRVVGIETPGAPGPEVLLLRSSRVSEPDWDAAFAAAVADGGPMGAELTRRKLIDSGELKALLLLAVADAMFVLAGGTVDEYRAEPGPVDFVLPLDPGVEADWLLADGRRTPRDLAFALGRGVYATLLKLARMHEAGLLVTTSYRTAFQPGIRRPGHPGRNGVPVPADGLPRRGKDPAGLIRRSAPWSRGRDLPVSLNMLRPRSRRDASGSETT